MPTSTDLVNAINQEIAKQPKGHVARSIFNVEAMKETYDFGHFIRFVSISEDGNANKQIAFKLKSFLSPLYAAFASAPEVEEKFMFDESFKQEVMAQIYEKLKNAWIQDRKMWGQGGDNILKKD